MKKILITGAKGQLGTAIQKISSHLSGFHFTATDVDNLNITNASEIQEFIAVTKPDFIINCAGYTAVDQAETDIDKAFLLNSKAVGLLSDEARKANARLIHISTDFVFQGDGHSPLTEDDPTNPLSVYGKSKEEGEKRIAGQEHVMIIRTSWLYSAYGKNFFKTIWRLSDERNEIQVINDQTGTPTLANDLAGAILNIVEKNSVNPDIFKAGVYHYSNEGSCTWYEFAREIVNLSQHPCEVKPVSTESFPLPAPRPAYSVMDKSKIKETYGLEIPAWKTSLIKCFEEYKYIISNE